MSNHFDVIVLVAAAGLPADHRFHLPERHDPPALAHDHGLDIGRRLQEIARAVGIPAAKG